MNVNPIDFVIFFFLMAIFLFLNYKAFKILWKMIYIYSKIFVIIVITLISYKYVMVYMLPIIKEFDIQTGGYISYFIDTSIFIQKFYKLYQEDIITVNIKEGDLTITNNVTENTLSSPNILYLIESLKKFIESFSK